MLSAWSDSSGNSRFPNVGQVEPYTLAVTPSLQQASTCEIENSVLPSLLAPV